MLMYFNIFKLQKNIFKFNYFELNKIKTSTIINELKCNENSHFVNFFLNKKIFIFDSNLPDCHQLNNNYTGISKKLNMYQIYFFTLKKQKFLTNFFVFLKNNNYIILIDKFLKKPFFKLLINSSVIFVIFEKNILIKYMHLYFFLSKLKFFMF